VILLDTNVISELMRQAPDPTVLDWLEARPVSELATTTVNIAEVKFGLARLGNSRRRNELERRFSNFIARGFVDRLFGFDGQAADAFAELVAARERSGRRLAGFDGLIAAIALSRGLGLATRNTGDFEGCGVPVINPCSANTR
jgi:predicted nucleic acid-binding protein